jgi:DNA modification methylase
VKLTELKPDKRNANKGTERGRRFIEQSLKRYGAGRSILLDRKGNIIAGNKTAEGASAVGLDDVVIVKTDGTKLIAVQRTDLDINSKAARELAIADNRANEVSLSWDLKVLESFKCEISLPKFWDDGELQKLLGIEPEKAPEPKLDQAAALQKKWGTKLGQLWLIGPHRLLCGDSTRKEDVARLWADVAPRERPVLMVTDPPYGVGYEAGWRAEAIGRAKTAREESSNLRNDDRAEWGKAYALFPGNVAYVWHASGFSDVVMASLRGAGFEVKQQIIWNKNVHALSRSHYHWKHEPCWYAIRSSTDAKWAGSRTEMTVWDINSIMFSGDKTAHPTQKPVECMAKAIRNHDAPSVYDPFLGSGTTMVAAQMEKRTCYGIDLDPSYVAVALQRLSDMNLKPKRANG